MKYHLDLVTPETWADFREAEATLPCARGSVARECCRLKQSAIVAPTRF